MDPYITGYTNFRNIFTSPFYNKPQHSGVHYFRPITKPIAFEYRKQYDLRCPFPHWMQSNILIYSPSVNLIWGIARIFFYFLPSYEHAFHIQFIFIDWTKGKNWTHTIKLRPNLYIIDVHRNLCTPMYTPWVSTVYTEHQNLWRSFQGYLLEPLK
jgi:hypothetical protein